MGDVTELLQAWADGDGAALERLLPLVYEVLRDIARRRLAHERAGHTLQPTALLHEAYLRLVRRDRSHPRNRQHLFALMATSMRRILVDHARGRATAKRGDGITLVGLDDASHGPRGEGVDVLALDQALERLAGFDARAAHVVELKYFGGLTDGEAALALGLSAATVKRDWTAARAWLFQELGGVAR